VRPVAAPAKSADLQGDAASSAGSAKAAASDSVVAGLTDPLAGPVSLAQFPDVVADAAESLTASVDATTATGAAATQPVKELQLDLAPADLGSVQVTMRLANGKLSIVVGVAKASTLTAIEGERDAIAARLGAGGSTLDSLVVKQINTTAAAAADSPEGALAGSQDNASNGANGDAPSGGDSASRRNGASDAGRRQSATQSAPNRRSSGDLVV
jgi:flagellar hook-length control protein FliK